MIAAAYFPLIAALVWLIAAGLRAFGPLRYRMAVYRTLVISGVAGLGWLTYHWGPAVGFAAFVIGLWILIRPPFEPKSRREFRIDGELH